MFLINLKRILRSGFLSFWRNGFVTLASISVLTVTLFVLGGFIFLDAMLDSTLEDVQEKVDVNVYFLPEASEPDVLAVQSKLESLPDIAEVEYVSRDQAIKDFEERHKDDELIIGALSELEDNPLGAYLNVRATDTSRYEAIATFIQTSASTGSGGENIIYDINFFQNKAAIEKLTDIINSIDTLSIVVLLFFALISILITFNTIRLAIYNSREEIAVMKLVGASNTYTRGPFVIEGLMYGIVSALLALILFYPVSLWLGPTTEQFFGSANMFDYYVDNFAELFVVLVIVGMLLGSISSYLAVKRYLKV